VVLITGGSRGLGLVLAREYLRAGARVAICARDEEELARAKRKLENEHGARVLALRCDLSDPAQLTGMLAAVRERFGGIDAVVNNAGVISVGPVEHMTQADFDEAMRVHFWAPLRVVDAVLPEMRERGSGRIVNIASLAGLIPVPHMLPYATSKAALVSWSDGLHTELKPHGVMVTTVCPGLVRTGSPRHAKFKGHHRDEHAWFSIVDSLPLLSAGAERAARKIMRASHLGHARVVMPGYTRVPPALYAVFPDLALAALALANRLMPEPGGIGEEALPGWQSESSASPSWITALSDRAAKRNNEL
jgi:NAD(P)-dependent dehydrogenase (short-subunit alcohol dehydrogenase family)